MRLHRFRSHLTGVFLALALSLPLNGRSETFIVVADEWEDYTAADGSGYWFDLLRLVYEPAGHALEFRIAPYPRVLNDIRKGKSHLTPATYRGDIEDSHAELSIVMEQDRVDCFVLEKNFPAWQGPSSLVGKQVGARLFYGFGRFLPEGVHYTEKPKLEGLLKMLAVGRLDAVLDYEEDVGALVRAGTLKQTWVMKPGVIQPAEYAAFAITPEGMRAREIFRQRMAVIIRDKLADPLLQKYGIPNRYRPYLTEAGPSDIPPSP
jgi:polar amino acid transport system substrate-binding protein